ncbi:MFS transporter [Arthrobacter sp. USHLN218]|uniref:MFS transporter n=1 Tax=Arthrobacter sp. USHLN218 TaxID=3081232 RepID=UPI0030180CB4
MDNVIAEDATKRPLDPSGRPGRRAGVPQAILLLAGSCMPIMGSVLLAPVLPRMGQEFAGTPGSEILVPLVLTAPALMMALLAPFAGAIADRTGRKRLLIAAMIAYAFLGTAPVWLDSLAAIVATRVGVGITEAAIMTCCTTLIADYFVGERRNKYLGLQAMLGTLAATAFMALGGALGSGGWQIPFGIYAVSLVIAAAMLFLLWEPGKADAPEAKVPVPWHAVGVPALVSLFGGIVFYALVVHLPFVIAGLGATDVSFIGMGAAIAAFATALGSISFRWLVRAGTGKLLPAALAVAAIGLLAVWLAPSPALAILGAVVAGLGTGVLLPTLLTWALSGLSFSERGRGTGIWTAAFWSGQFLTPIVIAALGGMAGGLQPGLGFLGALTLVAAAATAFAFTRRSNHRTAATKAAA